MYPTAPALALSADALQGEELPRRWAVKQLAAEHDSVQPTTQGTEQVDGAVPAPRSQCEGGDAHSWDGFLGQSSLWDTEPIRCELL